MTQSISKLAEKTESEAAEWFAKHQDGESSEADSEFREWLGYSPDNRVAYERCMAAWIMSGALKNDSDIQSLIAEARDEIRSVNSYRRKLYTYTRPMQMAASLLMVVGLTFVVVSMLSGDTNYKTLKGGHEVVLLDDGSVVTLNTDTEILVDYTQEARTLTLVRGEAYFDVESDKTRPFLVNVEGSQVRALGTEFNVAFTQNQIDVDVTEGVVSIKSEAGASTPNDNLLATLAVGEAVNFAVNTQRVKFEGADVERINAWRERKIYFKDSRLIDAVNDYNRYLDYEIEILGDELKEEKVTGVFQTNDTSSFIFTLKHALNVKVRHDEGKVFLYRG